MAVARLFLETTHTGGKQEREREIYGMENVELSEGSPAVPEDIITLRQLFTDIDPAIISRVYNENDQDIKATMQALAELARHSSGQAAASKVCACEDAGSCDSPPTLLCNPCRPHSPNLSL